MDVDPPDEFGFDELASAKEKLLVVRQTHLHLSLSTPVADSLVRPLPRWEGRGQPQSAKFVEETFRDCRYVIPLNCSEHQKFVFL